MAEIETLGILDEIRSIVADKLQVVSYKWVSRNFLVSSNAAKRLLQEFVEKNGNGLEVVFSLSGWLKNKPCTYNVMLVSKHKLADAKQDFNGHCSVQIYSIQACLPKDPATLWNHEFVQAEDLFNQPQTVDNCLRDNRFCGVSNSFVKRNAGETLLASTVIQAKTTEISESSKNHSRHHTSEVLPPQHSNAHKSDIEKVPQVLPNKKKNQSDKNSSETGGSLATLWGRASSKSKPHFPLAQSNNSMHNPAVSAEAQICDSEVAECGHSDEDAQDFSIKRTSNSEGSRKRRVVFDFSDQEDEDAVSLASPDPQKQSFPDSKYSSNASGLERNLNFENKENKPKIEKVKEADAKINEQLLKRNSVVSKDEKVESPIIEESPSHIPRTDVSLKDKVDDTGPKRRKVIKTRIDERGREVSEVIWDVDGPDAKTDGNLVKKEDNNTLNNPTDRPLVPRKSPAIGSNAPALQAGKTGNKKGANKDPKQGNILSFFKKA